MLSVRTVSAMLGLCIIASASSAAQMVNVSVDGTPVQFQGAGAQVVGGRVLVPLRGVLERMGAFVGWDASTRTVLAQRGDSDVVLPVGSKTAKVNGATVQLDVPAIILLGTTMVPLRFVGEALGADVKWNAATRTVEISSSGPAPAGETTSAGPVIRSFTHNSTGWLTAGDRLQVVLEGTPGGAASFEVPGITGLISMREVSKGRYEGVWSVPEGARSVSGAGVVAQLTIKGKSLLIQAGTPVSIDTSPPAIQSMTPSPGSSLARSMPSVSATYDDGSGSGIDLDSVRLLVGGANVTEQATVAASFVSYRPTSPLGAGAKTVTLSLRDKAGNAATRSWEFTVKEAVQVIKSVTYSAPADVGPGDVISVRIEGEKGGKARFWFVTPVGAKLREQPMQETSPGVYQGEYTIRRGDDLRGARVAGSLTTASGETYTLDAENKLGGQSASLLPPDISYPTEGKSVSSPLVITGTAAAGARVRLTVDYVSLVLGALRLTGAIADQIVTADQGGKFKSEPMDLGTMFGSKDTEYTLKAVTVGSEGAESEPKVVKFKKK